MKISRIDRQQIVKDSTKYLSATIIGQIVGLIRSIMVPVILSPSQLGIWNLMNVIIGYGNNAHLGILHGMNKIIPILRGQGKEVQIEDIKNSVFWANLLLCIVWSGILMVASFYVLEEYASGVRITSVVIFFQGMFLYLFSLIRAENRFNLVSLGVGGLSILSTIFVVVFGSIFHQKLIGMLIGLASAYSLTVIYFLIRGGYRFKFVIVSQAILNSFSMGIPLIILGFLDTLFISIDRWVIASNYGELSLGYYSIAISVSGLMGIIPGSISSVIYPKMLERFGAENNIFSVSSFFVGPTRAIALLMSLLIGGAILFLPMIIRFWLPKYLPSVQLIFILVPAAFFFALSFIPGSFLVSINKQRLLIKIQISVTILTLIINYVVVKIGFGIIGVAWVTAGSYFAYGFCYMYFASCFAFNKFIERIRFIFEIYILFIAMVLGLYVVNNLISEGETIFAAFFSNTKRFFLLLIIISPIMWATNKKGEIYSIINEFYKNRF